MRLPRVLLSPALIFSGFCSALLVAGCGAGGTPATPLPAPTLTFATIATQSVGSAPFAVSATSTSNGAVTYAVTSGPAVVSGNIVTVTGPGTVMLSASQAATSQFSVGTASTSFLVTQGTPVLSFATIATQLATNAPFTVSATSVSTGAVTYTVTSGPATINGSTLTLTGGTGTVMLGASQAATTNYAAATANTSFSVVATGATAGTSFTGKVQATGLPVVGASVQLYEAGTSGNGSRSNAASTVLTTDANGNFTVPSTFSCVSANTALFLVSRGGKVGSGGLVNGALWLAAALPPCGSLTNSLSVTVNELTTVATTEALSQFYSASGNIGASATNTLGLANTIVNAQMLANLTTGISPGASVPANVAVPSEKLNSLADAISSCAVVGNLGLSCTSLFDSTTNGTPPTNTLDAAFNIARNPGFNVAGIYGFSNGNTTFAPTLTSAPPDWMMYLEITGGGLSEPTALAVDGSGNLWVTDFESALSKFTPNGSAVFAGGITGPEFNESFGLAIDPSNNIWVESDQTAGSPNGGGSIAEIANNGTPITSGIGHTAGVFFPTGMAADTNGDIWIANYGNSTYAIYSNSGNVITANCNVNGCGAGELEFPVAVAVDGNHVGWFANQSDVFVTRISLDGTSMTEIPASEGPSGVAVDAQNNVWVANYFSSNISEISNAAVLVANYANADINHPQGIAVDGTGSVWVANYRGSSVSELAGANAATPGKALSPSTGYGTDTDLIEPFGLALDASGNVWVSSYVTNTIVEFLGEAVPVKTPVIGPVQIP